MDGWLPIYINKGRRITMGNICNVEPLQAQGTVVVDSAQSISSENPLQNKVVTIEKANASTLCVDLSGNPITFNADSQAVQKLQVALEPIQDLHGYANPWVGGAGKNLLPMTVESIKAANSTRTWTGNSTTISDVTFTIDTDSDGNVIGISTSGTASALIMFQVTGDIISSTFDGKVLNGCPASGSASTYRLLCLETGTAKATDTGSGATISGISANNSIQIRINSGTNMSGKVFYPMIRNSSESATFSPYTNICPISGRTGTGVDSHGRNWWDEEWELGSINPDSGATESNTGRIRSKNYVPVLGGTTYYFKCPSTSACRIAYYNSSKQYISGSWALNPNSTFTTPSNCAYMKFSPNNDYGTTYNNNICINVTDAQFNGQYEPYKTPVSCSMSFGQTVYGGTVDFKTGKVVVNKGYANLGSLTWNSTDIGYYTTDLAGLIKKPTSDVVVVSAISSKYEVVSRTALINSGAGSNKLGASQPGNIIVTSTESPTGDFVYELATPTELTLTPSELQLLKGYNYITADGNMEISIVPEDVIGYTMGQIISAMGTDESGRTTASRAYTTGEYFYKDGKMYKALTSIASGATFTVGTNCSQTTLFAELKAAQN